MSTRRATTSWVLAATYLGCSLAPFAHDLLLERESCEKCLATCQAPALEGTAGSIPPAGLPRLVHDHPPHEHDQCLICALGQVAAVTSHQVHLSPKLQPLTRAASPLASAVRDLYFLESQPARAPPSAS